MYGLPEFTVGGALRQFFAVVRRHAGTLLVSGLVLYAIPAAALGLLATSYAIPGAEAFQVAAATHRPMPDPAVIFGFLGVSLIVQMIGFTLAAAIVVRVAHEGLYGRHRNVGAALTAALRALPAAVVMYLLAGIATGLASLLLIVPGVMLFCRWSVAFPALMVERTGVLGSLARSRDLTAGHRWAVLGFQLVVALIVGVVVIAVSLGGLALGNAVGGTAGVAIRTIVGLLANAVAPALNGASAAALYFELRRAGEGTLSADMVEAFA